MLSNIGPLFRLRLSEVSPCPCLWSQVLVLILVLILVLEGQVRILSGFVLVKITVHHVVTYLLWYAIYCRMLKVQFPLLHTKMVAGCCGSTTVRY
jgi:hypothetical protein